MSRRFGGLTVVALYGTLFAGCASWLPAPTPMRTYSDRAQPDGTSRCLLVFMPGLGDTEQDFVEHGFIAAIRARNLPVDVISTNATLGYYARRTLLDRMQEDVIAPARTAGYEKIWVAGISMGGMGTLLVSKDEEARGRAISGAVLIAPYLGEKDVQKEISAAGGLARWQPGPRTPNEDYDRDVWRWLKNKTEKPNDASPSIYLAAGNEDKLAAAHRLLAPTLPKERVFRTPGNHDWGPWSLLWADFLDHSDFRASCSTR